MTQRTIVWYSCGAASAIAAKLTPEALPVYCETGAEHPDNARFLKDCEKWFGRQVTRLRSPDFASTWEVWEKTRWLAGIEGARCTTELKVKPRLGFQTPTDIHVFGYTADGPDVARAKRLRENYPELTILTPLIDKGITKAACIEMLNRSGVRPPLMYFLGFQNNNCIPCVKATSPDYWALIRREFPLEFQNMAILSRKLKVRLSRINDERIFIDEIPLDQPVTNPITPACDFLCHLAEMDMEQ